jgi:hypothetical protein
MAFEEDVPLFLGVGCTASWRCRDLRRGDEHGAPLPCTCIAATLQTSKFIPRNTNVHTLNDLNTIHTKAIYATIFAASGIFTFEFVIVPTKSQIPSSFLTFSSQLYIPIPKPRITRWLSIFVGVDAGKTSVHAIRSCVASETLASACPASDWSRARKHHTIMAYTWSRYPA